MSTNHAEARAAATPDSVDDQPDGPGRALVVANPATGEVLDLKALDDVDLVKAFEQAVDLAAALNNHGKDIQAEAIDRLDRRNLRNERIADGAELSTNAAQAEEYPVAATRAALERLVADDVLDASVIDRVIVTPAPADPPPPRVDKREINKLKRHPNPAVARELGTARELAPQRRTLKVERKEQ